MRGRRLPSLVAQRGTGHARQPGCGWWPYLLGATATVAAQRAASSWPWRGTGEQVDDGVYALTQRLSLGRTARTGREI